MLLIFQYSDGWLEQGDTTVGPIGSNAYCNITYLKEFKTHNNTINFSFRHTGGNWDEYGFITSKSSTGFQVYQSNGGSNWYLEYTVQGYASDTITKGIELVYYWKKTSDSADPSNPQSFSTQSANITYNVALEQFPVGYIYRKDVDPITPPTLEDNWLPCNGGIVLLNG